MLMHPVVASLPQLELPKMIASRQAALSTRTVVAPVLSHRLVRGMATQRVVGGHSKLSAAEVSTNVSTSTASPTVETKPAAAKDDVSGAMLEPSVVNTSWVRALATLAAVGAAAGSTAFLPANMSAFMHISAYGVWLGTMIWNTFFVGLTMFKNMPRQLFGRVQSHLFPKYFALTTGANVILLGSLILASSGEVDVRAATTLGVALAASMVNWLGIEPIATKLMFERYDLENLPEKNEEVKAKIQVLYKQFGKWHGISSLINLVITCCAFSHGWYLGTHLAL